MILNFNSNNLRSNLPPYKQTVISHFLYGNGRCSTQGIRWQPSRHGEETLYTFSSLEQKIGAHSYETRLSWFNTLARVAVRGRTSFSCCVAEALNVALLPSVLAWNPARTRIIFRSEVLAERKEGCVIKICHTAVAPVAFPKQRNKPTEKRYVRYESKVGHL